MLYFGLLIDILVIAVWITFTLQLKFCSLSFPLFDELGTENSTIFYGSVCGLQTCLLIVRGWYPPPAGVRALRKGEAVCWPCLGNAYFIYLVFLSGCPGCLITQTLLDGLDTQWHWSGPPWGYRRGSRRQEQRAAPALDLDVATLQMVPPDATWWSGEIFNKLHL